MLSLALLSLLTATAETPEKDFSIGALPALNYNSDEGFGYGLQKTL